MDKTYGIVAEIVTKNGDYMGHPLPAIHTSATDRSGYVYGL